MLAPVLVAEVSHVQMMGLVCRLVNPIVLSLALHPYAQ
jgi:hypothetical protein